MAEYRLSPAAVHDLQGIWNYTQHEWGPEQADHYVGMLATTFQRLAESPETAPACDHVRTGYRRWNAQRHVIYFRTTGYGIAVIRVLHGRMNVTRHL